MSLIEWSKRLWQSLTGRPGPGGVGPPLDGTAGGTSGPAAGVGPIRLRIGAVTTVGNHREHNEDNFFVPGSGTVAQHPEGLPATLIAPVVPAGTSSGRDPSPRLDVLGPFLVADGMGGQLAGEQASKIAVEAIPKELRSRLAPDADDRGIQAAVRGAVAAANREIIAQAHVMPEYTNMGTTVVLALFRNDRAYIAGIGDSRAYRLRGGSIERLTRDHDLATALLDAGTIRDDEAEKHQFRHVLYLYLGSPEARDGPEDVRIVDVRPGDKFLMASDGLTGVVRDEVLASILDRDDDPQSAARSLVERALANDSKDNVTCLVIYAD